MVRVNRAIMSWMASGKNEYKRMMFKRFQEKNIRGDELDDRKRR